MKALLLIDLQNDFMPGGALPVPGGFESVKAANFAQKFFEIVIATKDWHPAQHLSFATHHGEKKPEDIVEIGGIEQILWPPHCVQHTFGAALVKSLDQAKIQHVVTKGENIYVDSYSAFFDNAHQHETGLRRYLEQKSIDEVYLLGVATEYCVKWSAIDAVNLGLKTHVVIDGCRGIGLHKNDIAAATTEMADCGVNLLKLTDFANEF